MSKILCSKTRLDMYETFYEIEFNDCIGDLLRIPDVQGLGDFGQHFDTNRLQHSINVAYYSYLLCKILHWDFRSAARAGTLHDLFLYDWREMPQDEHHAFAHPKRALENARKNICLNPIEEDAILKHMWPLCKSAPRYKESFVVSLADKYCCAGEVISSFKTALARKYTNLKRRFA